MKERGSRRRRERRGEGEEGERGRDGGREMENKLGNARPATLVHVNLCSSSSILFCTHTCTFSNR